MAQTFTHLLTHVIFSTKERRRLLKVEIRPPLFSYAPAGLVRLLLFLPRVPLRSTLGYDPTAASRARALTGTALFGACAQGPRADGRGSVRFIAGRCKGR